MNDLYMLGIDLSKNVFQIHGVDARGNVMIRKQLRRAALKQFLATVPRCIVAMEACGGSHYWGRECRKYGHEVRLIPPQFVKPYVKGNKNDLADAEAIVEAAMRPGMRFAAVKEIWQQDILMIHRVRERLIRNRTSLQNEIRGLLNEYGVVFPQGRTSLRKGIGDILGSSGVSMSVEAKEIIGQLYKELLELEERVSGYDSKIQARYSANERCRRLGTIPGVGPITATALEAAVGDFRYFKNGRQLAASLGLVPRQNSTGGKQKLLGISKRGDIYIRKLLIHGARNVVRYATGKTDKRSRWVIHKSETRGFNKACVALANKNARICWALMVNGENYRR